MKTMLGSIVAVALVLFAVGLYAVRTATEPPSPLRTARVKRGNLTRTLTAKGTVKLEEVEVGAQVTGMIKEFGSDPATTGKPLDCGAHVRKGTVLARIDPTIYEAQVACAQASLRKVNANLLQSQAKCEQAEQEWKRAESLRPAKAIADSDYDLVRSNYRMAQANVAIWEAAVQESAASLRIAETNLGYTTIKSPCDGIIIDRRVNVGQTVVAAFNAPGLFLIAQDSLQMQVWVSVDEAEIGLIRPGLPVQFTVSACTDQSFEGKVAQIRLNPTRHQDAISYTVVVAANYLGNILPDMTANLQFVVDCRPNVLLIPNDAIQSPQVSDESPTAPEDRLAIDAFAVPPADEKLSDSMDQSLARRAATLWKERKLNRRLWVRDGQRVHPIDVQLGVSNGLMTEITGNSVKEGMEVICGEICMANSR